MKTELRVWRTLTLTFGCLADATTISRRRLLALVFSISKGDLLQQLFSVYKSAQKGWNILETSGVIWKWDVLCCIPLQSTFFLLYNATLFVTIASCRAEILAVWSGGVRKEMCHIWLNRAIHSGIDWNYHLGSRIDLAMFLSMFFCVAEHRFWRIFYLTLPPPKSNTVALKLTMVTNEVAL